MRVGLYGLPTAGKSFVLSAVRNLEVLSGSSLLKELAPDFHELSEIDKEKVRTKLALGLKKKDKFIMDGHYSFGTDVVFTEEDGQLYDTFLYLYVDPEIISGRMSDSIRNKKYLQYDIEKWQQFEIESLRSYCHVNNKDFYVIDNPVKGFFSDISMVLVFIDNIVSGYSCVNYAREVAEKIPVGNVISLVDGDKTFIKEDSSAVLGYKTHLFDGNFYTGFQAWRHNYEITDYLRFIDYAVQSIDDMNLTFNKSIQEKIEGTSVILTTGHYGTWKQIADKHNMLLFYGSQMCSDTKYFIAKFLQERGCKIIAFGDSMNDYYMLKQADVAYLVLKKDGSVSSSLGGRDLEGFVLV
jgi:soluble P-type ATPase